MGATSVTPPYMWLRLCVFYLYSVPTQTVYWLMCKVPPLRVLAQSFVQGKQKNAMKKWSTFPYARVLHFAMIKTYNVLKKAKVGVELLDIPLFTLEGDSCRLSHLVKEQRPLVLNFGSLT
ncbi:uncharacterized protein LOC101858561 [Aplysia californica]|uniref:Uncharacterized protein LOC101858561 n=1 Tax=Aplysia californica TaxID=6500 RepID=A0ABM0JUA0_APLCA|nr:uncharacterized protein LOC101858561 [Aplysia californica]